MPTARQTGLRQSLVPSAKTALKKSCCGLFALSIASLAVGIATSAAASAASKPAAAPQIAGVVRPQVESATSWPLFENDVYSDCTVASAGDLIRTWNLELGRTPSTLSDAQAVAIFKSFGGSVKTGIAIAPLVNRWETTGLAGSVIGNAAPLNHESVAVTKQAIYLLGGVIGEVVLTPATQLQLARGQTVTSTAKGSPSLAHALIIVGYNSQFLTVVTYGHVVQVSWAWWLTNSVLEYGVIPRLFNQLGHGPVPTVPLAHLSSWLVQHTVPVD